MGEAGTASPMEICSMGEAGTALGVARLLAGR